MEGMEASGVICLCCYIGMLWTGVPEQRNGPCLGDVISQLGAFVHHSGSNTVSFIIHKKNKEVVEFRCEYIIDLDIVGLRLGMNFQEQFSRTEDDSLTDQRKEGAFHSSPWAWRCGARKKMV